MKPVKESKYVICTSKNYCRPTNITKYVYSAKTTVLISPEHEVYNNNKLSVAFTMYNERLVIDEDKSYDILCLILYETIQLLTFLKMQIVQVKRDNSKLSVGSSWPHESYDFEALTPKKKIQKSNIPILNIERFQINLS